MIPTFPTLAKLELKHQSHIEAYIHQFDPYSDFTFISLWTYNTDNEIAISMLNGNLVVKFTDYISLKPFYSFIGTNKIKETIDLLLNDARKRGYEPYLKLVPEVAINADNELSNYYLIQEDKDNHDYIVSVDHLVELPDDIYKRKKYLINRFKSKYPNYAVQMLDLTKLPNQQKLIDVFLDWEKQMKKNREETANELTAIKRLFASAHVFDIFALIIAVDDKIIAFNTYEKSHGKYAVSSFQKADRTYTGIYATVAHEVAKHLRSLDCSYINYEQDLGIEGLRISKSRWKPVHYLKKYIISSKN